jgi:hypothetical protein
MSTNVRHGWYTNLTLGSHPDSIEHKINLANKCIDVHEGTECSIEVHIPVAVNCSYGTNLTVS